MIPSSLRSYLDDHHVAWHSFAHEPRFTAQEVASVAHVPGKRFAKVVLLEEGDGATPRYLLAVLPAHELVDLERLERAVARPLRVAGEDDFARLWPDWEPGAAPPFGELAHVPVVADTCLGREATIAFNGGTHTDVVEMRWEDYARLAQPRIVDCGCAPPSPTPGSRAPATVPHVCRRG